MKDLDKALARMRAYSKKRKIDMPIAGINDSGRLAGGKR